MRKSGMTDIVKNITRLVTGFIAVFGVYLALTGHLGPGGGFPGGVILAAAAVLVVLAFGGRFSDRLLNERKCHWVDAIGAGAFLLIAIAGYFFGGFFLNFIDGEALVGGGIIPLANLAIMVKVAAGLAGVFLALTLFKMNRTEG